MIERDIMRCGVEPYPARISKIIYDQSTGDVYIKGSPNAKKIY
jgi:hypothetical protein